MQNKKYKIILGSSSPRRRELLEYTALKFEVVTADIEEVSRYELPEDIVKDLAIQKAAAVYNKLDSEDIFVIGADTIVVKDNTLLGKPKTMSAARQMLMSLSHSSHDVLTGVSFVAKDLCYSFAVTTKVFFDEIDLDILEDYIDSKDSLDKAGAYGIQGQAMSFVSRVDGSYSNVVGLPISDVIKHLELCFKEKKWRDLFE